MIYTGKAQFSLIIIAPAELEAEGDRMFSLHAAWMEETHYREGEKALLQYTVAKRSDDDGNIIFVLTEVYETMAGVEDHYEQFSHCEWRDDWQKFTGQCQVTYGGGASIIHSLW
jgi:hypothetical protein